MITKNKNGFSWGSLLVSILLFLASWTALRNPIGTLVTLGLLFGIVAIVQGIVSFIIYSELRKVFSRNPWPILVVGVLDLIIGLYLVFNPTISITFLPLLFAAWFILDSVMNMVLAFRLRGNQPKWFWIYFILGILGVLLGIFLATNLAVAIISITSLIAVYFLIAGIIRLIDAFV